MKVFVTGANGLLGCNLVRELIMKGHEVKILVRQGSDLTGLKGIECETIYGDLPDEDLLVKATTGFDVVVHAAANTSQWPSDLRFYQRTNIQGTETIIKAVLKNKIPKLIHVSTANTIGYGTKENPGTESSPWKFRNLKSGYVTSKYIAEQMVLEKLRTESLQAVIVNPTFMIGPFDTKPGAGKIITRVLNRKLQVFPVGGKNFVHVRDVAMGVCNAIRDGRTGERYLLANENLTFREFYLKVIKVTGAHSFQFSIPAPLIQLAGLAGSGFERISGIPVPLNSSNAKLLTLGNYYSGMKAVEELRMPQTPIETAILEAITWWKENHLL